MFIFKTLNASYPQINLTSKTVLTMMKPQVCQYFAQTAIVLSD
ncbi:hypothetical protein J542_2470 [Acinetobacter baumannii 299505]|nr:hypothetical protein J542_2470 [Acinetobacter baumannii 299505]